MSDVNPSHPHVLVNPFPSHVLGSASTTLPDAMLTCTELITETIFSMPLWVDDIPVNEKALWLAVLIQTTVDLVGINLPTNKRRENIHVRSAHKWFEGDGDDIGGFVWVCQIL
jgi:hypothetical protein